MHLLIADDSDDDVLLLKEAFRLAGQAVTVTRALDGQRAAEILIQDSRGSFDLVVLDYYLPRHDAPDVLERVRQAGAFPPTPVVVLSSHVADGDITRLRALGATLIAEKPADLDGLCALARQMRDLASP